MSIIKKQKSFFIFMAVLIGILLGLLFWNVFTPNLSDGVFYYKVNNNKADLFLLSGKSKPKQIASLPAREVDIGKYKPPNHSYVSENGKQMIYFKKIGEEPIENIGEENIVINRVISKPILVNLKTGKEREIEQPIDSSGLVFSSDANQIAWIKEVEESTFQGIEESGRKRELWISRSDGENAEFIRGFDENVILLKKWDNDYVYFQGLWDVSIRSLGRVNIKTREINYIVPRFCENYLQNCQNIEFSSSGNYFLYEVYTNEDNKEITELYFGNFNEKEYVKILTTDRISDKIWLDGNKKFLYTEQEMVRKEEGGGEKELQETIHLVDIGKQTDDKIYSGSYISQLSPDPNMKYLYFLEKEKEGENFHLVKLNLKTKESEIILTEDYNYILLLK